MYVYNIKKEVQIIRHSIIKFQLWIFIGIIMALFSGCSRGIVGKVGDETITKRDIIYTQNIEKAYEDTIKEEEALLIYIQKLLDVEIAKDIGISLSDAQIQKESSRIDTETKAPKLLARIKKCFGRRKNDYLRVFVKPVLARRLIEEKFFYDTLSYQKYTYNKAKEIEKNFNTLIRNKKVRDTLQYFLAKKKDHLYGFFHPLNITSHPQIVKDKMTYYIVHKRKNMGYEGFIVQKADFNEFYEKEMQKIPVVIKNKQMRERLLMKIRGTKWEKIIK